MKQKEVFTHGEGDQWFLRNQSTLNPDHDEYVALLSSLEINPTNVVEIGCSNGYHLEAIRQSFNCRVSGIDPSSQAIAEGNKMFPLLDLEVATANALPYSDAQFDLVILGFCLYLCDREDLFSIAQEVDRVLADGGFILIKDFCPPLSYRNSYGHKEGLFSFKMDYGKMFTWNPAYQIVHFQRIAHTTKGNRFEPDEQIAMQLIRKDMEAFELNNPFNQT